MFKIKDNYIYRQCVNDSILIEKLNENNLEIFFDSKIFQEMLMVANPRFFNELTKEKIYQPQLFTPNLKTIQNPCLSLDPGWFLFS
ncbi:hypothetical protein, partial [Streptococcus pneumoniae]|uniref:hypothetical protein n=3 Tax=Streptococcus pneumoniae TaxID=1313 RepID=UPI001F448D39